jgi:DNA-binding winged helix-turn-helix (wHTH) protein/predicted Zn-dependent protease
MLSDVVRLDANLELDPRAYELRRSGRRLKLERIPMELLLLLVERRGELVTREEIIERIWGKDVFLDTDSGINAAIRKIRQVLKDDPEKPLFVQTITGKGYRFVAPMVEVEAPVGGQGGATVKADIVGSALVNSVNRDLVGATISGAGAPSVIGKHWRMIVPAAVTGLALSVGGYLYFHRAPKLTDKDTIVLADFTNTTGDPVFDGTLRQGMAVQLEQSPFLSLISEERIHQVLRLMDKPADTRLTPDIAREICERTASAAVLDGSIASLGSQYVLGLRARDCRTGDVIADEQVQAARKEDVLNALGQIASKFRTRVGESLATVEKYDTPLAEATTPYLEALRAYSTGWKVSFSAGAAAAVPFLNRAIEIDPNFASAYAMLARLYGDIGESELSAKNASKAYELRGRASEQEKFFISTSYQLQATGNLEKAQQACELWMQAYPRAWLPHGLLSGGIYPQLGKYEGAVKEARIALEIDPDFSIGYANLAGSYVALDRLDEAEATLRRAVDRKLEIPDFFVLRYVIALLKNDESGMERQAALAREKAGADDWMSNSEGFVLAYSGRLEEARTMSRRAADLARKAERRDTEALYETDAAVREALFGNASTAMQRVGHALELSKSRDVEYGSAFALALSGDSSRSQALSDELPRRFPEDTRVQFAYLPTLRALLALNHSEPSNAVEVLQTAIAYEAGTLNEGGSEFLLGTGNFYSAYVRGLAYLAAHQGREAAVEFQKILAHRGIVLTDPIGALAHLQLGRAYALSGDKTKARSAYQDFLTLWKDADTDIPIFKQAEAEYAKLQ